LDTIGVADGAKTRVRIATMADLPVIMRHRRQMYLDMGYKDETSLRAMETTSTAYLKAGLENGSYRAWLVETPQGVVAGGGVVLLDFPSSPRDPSLRRAYIINMYTEPEFRRHGLAKLIMEEMIRWCREQGFAWVTLHASDAGRHLYETLGFKPTNEMRLPLR
jgi:GNAT superfamily N-acetyltransferase